MNATMPPTVLPLIEWFARGPAAGEYPGLRSDAGVADGLGYLLLNKLATGGAGGQFALTDRGTAFLRILLSTPLPVQAWIDPRGDAPAQVVANEAFTPGRVVTNTGGPADRLSAGSDFTRTSFDLEKAGQGEAETPPDDDAGNIDPAILEAARRQVLNPDAWERHSLPSDDDFIPWKSKTPAPPHGIGHGTFVEAFLLDGSVLRQYAASINWKTRGKRHDVIGYRVAEDPNAPKTPLADRG